MTGRGTRSAATSGHTPACCSAGTPPRRGRLLARAHSRKPVSLGTTNRSSTWFAPRSAEPHTPGRFAGPKKQVEIGVAQPVWTPMFPVIGLLTKTRGQRTLPEREAAAPARHPSPDHEIPTCSPARWRADEPDSDVDIPAADVPSVLVLLDFQ